MDIGRIEELAEQFIKSNKIEGCALILIKHFIKYLEEKMEEEKCDCEDSNGVLSYKFCVDCGKVVD